MKGNKRWIEEGKKTITKTKLMLGSLVAGVRTQQFKIFKKYINPSRSSEILDVGVSSEEDIKGTNMFEKLYRFPVNLTLATIENPQKLEKLYPFSKTVKIQPDSELPFENKEFDIAVSWATLEHIGDYKKQEFFLNELLRVADKVFITTPYRGCVYEPHSGTFFLHWLPIKVFRYFCKISGKKFWSDPNNLNPLYIRDIEKMSLVKKPKVILYKMLGLLPSHLLIVFK